MSFNVLLQVNSSEKYRVNKSVSTLITLTGTLKNETSIIDPVILVEGDLTSYATCNYMTIETFGRSYFITNIRSVRENLFEVSGHVDVLSSFKSQLLSNSGIIKRQENSWNLYLNDGTFKVYQNPQIVTKEFPYGFSSPEFVLAVAGS